MIKISKSKNADTRSAVGKVSKQDLLNNSISHIGDVKMLSEWIASKLIEQCTNHDYTKVRDIEQFHNDFENTRDNGVNFVELTWYRNHITEERHHLSDDNFPIDVNMIDVLEMILDNVAAGIARSGEIRDIHIPNEVVQLAIQNTAKLLSKQIEIVV